MNLYIVRHEQAQQLPDTIISANNYRNAGHQACKFSGIELDQDVDTTILTICPIGKLEADNIAPELIPEHGQVAAISREVLDVLLGEAIED